MLCGFNYRFLNKPCSGGSSPFHYAHHLSCSPCVAHTLFMNTINVIIALYLPFLFLSWPLFSCFFFKASPICLLVPTYPYLLIFLQSAVLSVHTVRTLTQEARSLGKNLSVPGSFCSRHLNCLLEKPLQGKHCPIWKLAGFTMVIANEQFKDVLFLDIQKALKPSSHSFQPVIFEKKKIELSLQTFFINNAKLCSFLCQPDAEIYPPLEQTILLGIFHKFPLLLSSDKYIT